MVGVPHMVTLDPLSLLAMAIISFQSSFWDIDMSWFFTSLGDCIMQPTYQKYLTNIVLTEHVVRAIAMSSIVSNVVLLAVPLHSMMAWI